MSKTTPEAMLPDVKKLIFQSQESEKSAIEKQNYFEKRTCT